jgi:hypothetical protein
MAESITISMAERAVPSSTSVQSLRVSKKARYSAMVSRIIWRNCGSNCPSNCVDIALSTRGSALMGPGPISKRGAGFSSSKALWASASGESLGNMARVQSG